MIFYKMKELKEKERIFFLLLFLVFLMCCHFWPSLLESLFLGHNSDAPDGRESRSALGEKLFLLEILKERFM